jgi:hypothetical protein
MIVTMYTAIVLLNPTLHTGTKRTIAVYIVTIIHYIPEQEEQ